MGKSLREMTAEVRAVNTDKGWRTVRNPWPEYVALLHSEITEALEAFRDHRLADATGPGAFYPAKNVRILPKPEGVGSEFADVLIRLLDMCDVWELSPFEMDLEIGDVATFPVLPEWVDSFPSALAWLHVCVADVTDWRGVGDRMAFRLSYLMRALVTVAEAYNINLTAEFDRKLAYNRTRPYQHGGRTISDAEVAS